MCHWVAGALLPAAGMAGRQHPLCVAYHCKRRAMFGKLAGGASFCGASGSPVAAKAMQCAGTEMSLKECKHDAPDDACLSHASDSVVFCGASTTSAFFDGELRLIGASGAPVLRYEVGRLEMYLAHTQAWAPVCRQGFTSGSATVACKTMGFVVVLQGFLRAAQATCAERCRLMFRL